MMMSGAQACSNPTISTDTYTSKNIALSASTAYLAEFTVTCKEDDVKGMNLYAEVEQGVLTPVAMIPESESYQLSWVKEHKKATTGSISIKLFNDDGYTAYRKAQRSESGDLSEVAPLLTFQVEHSGVAKEGLFVQTEFIAVVAALLIWWCANSLKSQIME